MKERNREHYEQKNTWQRNIIVRRPCPTHNLWQQHDNFKAIVVNWLIASIVSFFSGSHKKGQITTTITISIYLVLVRYADVIVDIFARSQFDFFMQETRRGLWSLMTPYVLGRLLKAGTESGTFTLLTAVFQTVQVAVHH